MDPAVAMITGRRRQVHRLPDDAKRTGACHSVEDEDTAMVGAREFAEIARLNSRRLCGHCYRTEDRA